MDDNLLYTAGLTLEGWKLVRINDPRPLDGYIIEGFISKSYLMEKDGESLTMGVYFLHDKEVYRSWIVKGAPHCVHVIVTEKGMSDQITDCVRHTIIAREDGSAQLILSLTEGTVTHEVKLIPQKKLFKIEGITCSNCVAKVTELLSSDSSLKTVSISLESQTISVESYIPINAESLNTYLSDTKYRISEFTVHKKTESFSLKTFLPLIALATAVVLFALAHQFAYGLHGHIFMQYFMAGYFLLFGGLKVINWKKFVVSYRAYDAVAKKSLVYACVYPAIEFGLGAAYYFAFALTFVNVFVVTLMLQKAYSVYLKIRSGETVQCACLGGFFSIPVTKVTLAEDLLMAGMALWMLL